MNNLTPVVKNLILLNILVFVACLIYGDDLTNLLAMHYPANPEFKPWQIITHMFTHGGIFHILFNMYALYSFGAILENERVLGSKRFAFLYLFSGLGAIAFHLAVQAFVVWQQTGSIFLSYEQATSSNQLASIYFSGLVGASGAIYGLLAAFGYLFPNAPLMFMFVPVPIKAKYMIPLVIIGFDIMFAQTGVGNIAHTAHIGGAIFGFLLVLFWNKTNKETFY
ncbi:MAG: rhomboid family intramembrane serine protease [Chitinophagales bacterium]